MLDFRELFTAPRRAATSYSHLLPWFGLVTPGIVLCHDGTLLAGFEYSGRDVEGLEEFEIDQKIDLLQNGLRALNDRCTLWTVQERRFTEGYLNNHFSSAVAMRIDEQWEQACSATRNAVVKQRIYIGYSIPNKSEAFLEGLATEIRDNDGKVLSSIGSFLRRRMSERGAVAGIRGQLLEMVSEFEKVIGGFMGVVELNLGVSRMFADMLLGELYSRANLTQEAQPIRTPERATYVNTFLASDSVVREHDLFKFVGPTSKKWVAALTTTGTPQSAICYHVDNLMAADCEYVLVQTFRFIDRMGAEKAIQDAEMFYRSEVKSVLTQAAEHLFDMESEKVNTGNLHLADDAQEALVELTAGDIAYGYYNMTLLGLGDSPKQAEAAVDTLAGQMRANGYTVIRERHGLLSAILTSMPGNAKATLRWKLASVANLADLAPIRTISRGEESHPLFSKVYGHEVPPLCRFVTPYGITYDYNMHEGDLGHCAVVGGSGAGKTSILTLLISQFQKYTPSQTYIFDKDYSLMMLTCLLGGKHQDMSPRGVPPKMNPVRVMMSNGDDSRLRQWIEILIGASGQSVSPQESAIIHSAILGLRRSPQSAWQLSGIHGLIKGEDRTLADKIAAYVDQSNEEDDLANGPFANYFDNAEDHFELTRIVGMECNGILESPQLASPFMDYAFYVIERSLDGKTPTLIYIEEAWYMLKNPVFLAQLEDWLRTFRKKRAKIVFATQALDEISRLPNVGSFMTNIPSQIFLPSVRSSVREQAGLFKSLFGTTDAQIDLLAQAIPKRDYLLVKPSCTRLVQAQMPPLIIAINEATTQAHMREKLLKYQAEGGPDWEMRFVEEVLGVKS